MITIKTRTDRTFTTKAGIKSKNFIQQDTYIYQESVRVVKFKNGLNELIIIPWENVDFIVQKKDTDE